MLLNLTDSAQPVQMYGAAFRLREPRFGIRRGRKSQIPLVSASAQASHGRSYIVLRIARRRHAVCSIVRPGCMRVGHPCRRCVKRLGKAAQHRSCKQVRASSKSTSMCMQIAHAQSDYGCCAYVCGLQHVDQVYVACAKADKEDASRRD